MVQPTMVKLPTRWLPSMSIVLYCIAAASVITGMDRNSAIFGLAVTEKTVWRQQDAMPPPRAERLTMSLHSPDPCPFGIKTVRLPNVGKSLGFFFLKLPSPRGFFLFA